MKIFQDTGQALYDFSDLILVRCPRCNRQAQVMRIALAENQGQMAGSGSESYERIFHPRKLSCLHCGLTKIWNEHGIYMSRRRPHDWYFCLPLWLQTPCCGEILWAFNREHLNFLERFVSATQRIRFYEPGQIRNGTMASRLPLWMKRAKNRETVLKSIAHLRII